MKINLSMTTIPRRFDFLTKECYPAIEKSVVKVRERIKTDYNMEINDFVLTLDDNLTDEDYKKYDDWAAEQHSLNIIIRKDNHEYRCINKEIGGAESCKMNSAVAFITLDDDQIYNDSNKFYDLCKYAFSFPDDVICIETNPVVVDNGQVNIICGLPPKIAALRCNSKILSNFCLFPANCFEGTRIADLDYIREHEWNRHDELFAWAELTRKGIRSVVLPNTYSLAWDNFDTDHTGDEQGLRDYNSVHWNDWTMKINQVYPDIARKLEYEVWEYIIEDTNAFAVGLLNQKGILNGIGASYKKIISVNTQMLHSKSYEKFMFRH